MLINDPDSDNKNLDSKFAENARPSEQDTLCGIMRNSCLFDTEELVIQNVDTWIDLIKGHLLTKGYDHAVFALDAMLDCNEGLKRKDGITPSIVHELTQLTWVVSLLDDDLTVENPEGVLINTIMHDMGEEHGWKPPRLAEMILTCQPVNDFDALNEVKTAHGILSKDYLGEESEKIPAETLFKRTAKSKNASVVKIPDRIHNVSTHIGVKDSEKSASYIKSTRENFIPAIENLSKEHYPKQTEVYDTLLDILNATCELTEMHYNGEEMPDNDTILSMMPEHGFKKLPRGINPLLVVANRSRATNLSSDPDMNIQQG